MTLWWLEMWRAWLQALHPGHGDRRACFKGPLSAEEVEELARAWEEHLESTRRVAAKAAQNAEEAERLKDELIALVAKMAQRDKSGDH